MKKICTLELLSAKRVRSFRSVREAEVSHLIKWIASREGSSINLSKQISSLAVNVVWRTAFGSRGSEYQEKFLSVLEETVKLEEGFNVADLFPSIEGFVMWLTGLKAEITRFHHQLDLIFDDIINQHRRREYDSDDGQRIEDLVDVLLKVQENGDAGFRLTTDNIKAVLQVSDFLKSQP